MNTNTRPAAFGSRGRPAFRPPMSAPAGDQASMYERLRGGGGLYLSAIAVGCAVQLDKHLPSTELAIGVGMRLTTLAR